MLLDWKSFQSCLLSFCIIFFCDFTTLLISGFWHEHQRYDRDNYVKINFENIQEEGKHNFQKREEEYCETFEKDVISKIPYDYCSLMHYPENAGAKVRYHFLSSISDCYIILLCRMKQNP